MIFDVYEYASMCESLIETEVNLNFQFLIGSTRV